MNDKALWENLHKKLLPPKGSVPTEFGILAEEFFAHSRVLDLGAGAGLDSIYFAHQGHIVEATDLSDTALSRIQEDIPAELADKVIVNKLDLAESFPYPNESFDVVYAATSIHYFDKTITQQIFSEIHRVLKPNGIVSLLLNSKADAEYGVGRKIEEDYFEVPPYGIWKRFFDTEDVANLADGLFVTVLLDDKGRRIRSDRTTEGLRIRYIGKKIN